MFETIIQTLFQIVFIVILIFSVFHWIRTGLWVPRYIHFIALLMLFVGALMSYIAHTENGSNTALTICLVIGFPAVVYIIYGFYGGGLHSKDIKVNPNFIVDRAMLKVEVIEIFNEHFDPYTKWPFENLLMLTIKKHREEVQGKSGKKYLFELEAESYDGEDREKIVALYGTLVEVSRKFYKPKSRLVFEVSRKGIVYRNGLNFST